MKGRIITLRDGRTNCRILDKCLDNGTTYYLGINIDTHELMTFKPKDIYDILEMSQLDNKEISSIRKTISKGI